MRLLSWEKKNIIEREWEYGNLENEEFVKVLCWEIDEKDSGIDGRSD